MIINKLLLNLILLLSVTFAACKKDKNSTNDDQLPPATQTGANTFGCLINGKVYKPNGGGIAIQSLSVSYDPTFQGGKLGIRTSMRNPSKIDLTINADSINSIGTYTLVQASKYWIFYADFNVNNCSFETINTPPTSGILTITKFDIVNKIVSGTFSFKVSTSTCGVIDATDGRFDVKY
jgi:hypothetical protein